jgi:hypothetical protein
MILREHITNNQLNFKFVPILHKIEEHLIALHLAFAQIFQLKGYGQYEMHGSIVNVPKNLDLVQIILPRLPYDDSSILVFLKRKLEYKSMYMLGYVHFNIMIKKFKNFAKLHYIKVQKIQLDQIGKI